MINWRSASRNPGIDNENDFKSQKTRTPSGFHRAGFINSGDVLLSRNLEMHYHWGCSVSLPCSEWERVGPLRYDHQKAGEAEVSPRGDGGGLTLNFTRNSDGQNN